MKLDEQWAAIEFADVELQDARVNRRCQQLAVALGQQPPASINQACEDWADTKAAYRFLGNTDKVTPTGISAPHQQRTEERMSQHPLVLAVQDLAFFNYTHHPHTEGLGEIGNKKQQQRSFGLPSTLVVTPAGVPMGTLTQQFFIWPIGEPAHTPRALQQLPLEEKESYRWLEAFEQTLHLSPAGLEVVTICDPEAEIYEMLVLAEDKKASLVIRASVDWVLAEKEVRELGAKVEQQPHALLVRKASYTQEGLTLKHIWSHNASHLEVFMGQGMTWIDIPSRIYCQQGHTDITQVRHQIDFLDQRILATELDR